MIEALLMFASLMTGYPVPDYPPIVRYESPAAMEAVMGFAVDGYYDGGIVRVSNEVEPLSLEQRVILVHELTHFLQDAAGDDRPRCLKEREAYEVHFAYSWANGVEPRKDLAWLFATTCARPWEPGR